MNQQHPHNPNQPQQPWGAQPTQPGYGYPPQPGMPQPQPPKKRRTGKVLGITAAVFAGLIVIGAVAGGGDTDSAADTSNKDKASSADSKPKTTGDDKTEKTDKADAAPAKDQSQADQFKACVNKTGTPAEKTAIKHVTKVTGADKTNDILDAAEVFTDFTGGLMSKNNGDAKLIASAFASCYESKNGLVTVYGSDGDMISNGNY